MVAPIGAGAAALSVAAALLLPLSDEGGEPSMGREASPSLSALIGGGEALYRAAESPAALAAEVKEGAKFGSLIVRGSILGFGPGRTYGVGADFPEDPGTSTVTMKVAVDEVFDGDDGVGQGESVFVEFEAASDAAPVLEERLPTGTPVLLYLARLGPDGFYPKQEITDDNGPAAGQPLYRTWTPQAFFVADDESDVLLQPEQGAIIRGATLADVEPQVRDAFPEATFESSINAVGGGVG